MAAPFHLARRSSLFIPCCPFLLSPRFLFPYVFPCVSLVVSFVRLVGRLVMSSRSVVPLRRAVRRAVLPVRLVVPASRLVWAPFRFAVRSFSFRLSGRSCLVFSSRLVFALALRLVLAFRPSSRRIISFFPVVSFRLTRGRLVPVLVPGSRVRAVPFCSPLVPHSLRSSVSVHVLGRGEGLCRYGHGAWVACSSRLIRSLVAGRLCGRMWALGAVSCCSPLITCPLIPHCSPSPTGSLAPMRAHPPHPRSKTTMERMAKADGEGQTRKTRRPSDENERTGGRRDEPFRFF